MKPKSTQSSGFALIELLTVIAIIVLLVALATPAINSIGSADRLSSAARLLSNMMTIARSEAINGRSPVQLRVVTDKWQSSGSENYDAHYRKMSLWKYDRNQNAYVQHSKWEVLPPGVVIEPDPSSTYSFAKNPGTCFVTSDDFKLPNEAMNNAVVNAAFVEFSPDGSLQTGASQISRGYLLLVEGHIPDGHSTPVTSGAGKNNWAQVGVSPLTGRINVVRP